MFINDNFMSKNKNKKKNKRIDCRNLLNLYMNLYISIYECIKSIYEPMLIEYFYFLFLVL